MAGAIWHPNSVACVTAPKVFPALYVCAGAGFKRFRGMGWMASLDGDALWELVFTPFGSALPSGTAKFSAWCFANATTGAAKFNIKWASAALGEDPSGLTLQAEGTSTLTWAAGGGDKPLELLVTLDADTITAAESVVMQVVGETTGWTLAQYLAMVSPRIIFV